LEHLISPYLLYGACALGALGVALALPKRKFSPFIFGGLIGAIALGVLLIALGQAADDGQRPSFYFYIFAILSLFGAVRMISQPRPIYAALYFILTILASCGLYVLLSAEFLAFALVIVYAGAILITYLFVIMLATEAPSNDALDVLAEYDRYSREPIMATMAGFVLLAALTTVLATGSSTLRADPTLASRDNRNQRLDDLPRKVDAILAGAIDHEGKPLLREGEKLAKQDQKWAVFPRQDGKGYLVVADKAGGRRQIPQSAWPHDLRVDNVEAVAFTLIGDKAGAIEIAGVILLMAMLGAVVLARKKVDLDEAAKRAAITDGGRSSGPASAGSSNGQRRPVAAGGGA
jgi:NADH-quinone oxidoreductase subunit J